MGISLTDGMTWSFSRIKAFEDCPYKWFLKYICKLPSKEMFFASYGSFIHKLLEQYYSGKKSKEELATIYLAEFMNEVKGQPMNASIKSNYFLSGLSYIQDFEPLRYEVLDAEKKVKIKRTFGELPFVGIIDIFGKNEDGLVVCDHKSRKLKPRSKRAKPTKTDQELDELLIQLYIYSAAVFEEYGEFPKTLSVNSFRVPVLIEEPFRDEAYEAAIKWVTDSVEKIGNETKFRPNIDFFKCTHLCEMQDHCEYYELIKGR